VLGRCRTLPGTTARRYPAAMIELLTNDEMAEADRRTIASGLAGADLMENAGVAVAKAVARRHPPGSKVAVVAGPGNNGGDGFVAARHLAASGFRVRVCLIGTRDRLKGDAAWAAGRWEGAVASAPDLSGAAVIIDALFGAGLDRPVTGDALAAVEAMNAAGCPIVAIDLASGINGTTGAVMGAAVRATESVTFFRRKPGHLLLPGRIYCGPAGVADIGIKAGTLAAIKPATFENAPPLWRNRFPVPELEGHKYSRGHAVVVSGDASHTGAARLTAMAALRAGAGLVTIASPRAALAVNAAANLAVMVRPADGAAELEMLLSDKRLNAVAIGPGAGVGAATREMVMASLRGERAVVIDADGLTSFAQGGKDEFFAALAANGKAVLTPHSGEFHRLFDGALAPSGSAKTDLARAAARRSGAVVVFKGADTVIAAPDGRAAINANAPPWLATAGTGDVLAGLAAGLLAQGMPPFEAACAAVWIHGEAATAAGPGMISEDLAPRIPEIYARWLGTRAAPQTHHDGLGRNRAAYSAGHIC
jgi:ADP-dependent NAD(P)H-hydrate dehydratase / NAD(P)H-hydrate epimerase